MSEESAKPLHLGKVQPSTFIKNAWENVPGRRPASDVRAAVAESLSNLQEMSLGDLAGRVRGLVDFAEDAGHPEIGEEVVREVGRVLGEDVLEGWLEDVVDLATKKAATGGDPAPVLFSCTACRLQWVKTDAAPECPECRRRTFEERRLQEESTSDDWWLKAKPTFDEVLRPAGHLGPAYKVGLTPLGFKSKAKAGDTEALLVTMGQLPLRPTLLLIAPECPDGHVVDLYTANWTEIGGVDPVPISLFQPNKWRKVPELPRWQLWKTHTMSIAQTAKLVLRFDEPLARPQLVKAMLWCVGADS